MLSMQVLVNLLSIRTLEGCIGMLEGTVGEVWVLVLEVGTCGGGSHTEILGRRVRCHGLFNSN